MTVAVGSETYRFLSANSAQKNIRKVQMVVLHKIGFAIL